MHIVGFFHGLLAKQILTSALVVIEMVLLARRIALLFKHTSLRTHVQLNWSRLKCHLLFQVVHQKDVAGAEDISVFSIGRSGFEKCLGHNAMLSNIVRNVPERLVQFTRCNCWGA